jgi:hypothetical protein
MIGLVLVLGMYGLGEIKGCYYSNCNQAREANWVDEATKRIEYGWCFSTNSRNFYCWRAAKGRF